MKTSSSPLSAETDLRLNNTQYRLTVDCELTVGFLGGSITVGVGASDAEKTSWRALTVQWLREQYPQAAIRDFSLAVSGRGSAVGVCQVGGGLPQRERPDLLFLEFAINDRHECRPYSVSERNMESLVRMLRQENPYTDIVLVYTSDGRNCGNDFDAIRAFDSVAERYGLPRVNVGRKLALQEGPEAFQKGGRFLADNVHPNDAGHRRYATFVTEYLQTLLDGAAPTARQPHTLPAPGRNDLYTKGHRLSAAELAADLPEANRREDGVLLSPHRSIVAALRGEQLALHWQAPWGLSLEVSLDGQEPQRIDGVPYGTYHVLYEALSRQTHRLQLTNCGDSDCLIYELIGIE